MLLTVATDNQKSAAYCVNDRCHGAMIVIPALENPTDVVRMEIYHGPLLSPAQGSNAALAADEDTNWSEVDVDISTGGGVISAVTKDWILRGLWIRIVVDTAQTSNRTFQIIW